MCQDPSTTGSGASASQACFSGMYDAALMGPRALAAGRAGGWGGGAAVLLTRRLGTYLHSQQLTVRTAGMSTSCWYIITVDANNPQQHHDATK